MGQWCCNNIREDYFIGGREMKFGPRKPNYKSSIKARTTGRVKRSAKKAVNPLYGKKGMGWVNNPKKAAYNKVYNKTTFNAFGKYNRGMVSNSNDFDGIPQLIMVAIFGTFFSTILLNATSGIWLFLSFLFFILCVGIDLLLLFSAVMLIAIHPWMSLFIGGILVVPFHFLFLFFEIWDYLLLTSIIIYIIGIIVRVIFKPEA